MTDHLTSSDSQSRVAIVTGGAKGMGYHMVLALLEQGHRVAVVDRDRAAMASFDAVSKDEKQLLRLSVDLTSSQAIGTVISSVVTHFGQLDILVNNAGLGQASIRPDNWKNPLRFWDVTPSQWQDFLDLNCTAAFFLSRAAVPDMIRQGWGRIINVTTSLDTMLRGGFAPYGPSKAALEAATAIMAADLEEFPRITANVLVPGGPTDTSLIPSDAGFDRSTMLPADIMAAPLQWLVSDACDAVSGQRVIAARWDRKLAPSAAMKIASSPAAWGALGQQMIKPAFAST